jgi:predicted membrane protein
MGVLVIAVGVLFLLDNLDILDFRHALSFWPVAFIVGGVLKLFDTSSPNNYLVGGLLVAAGATMILARLGIFYVDWQTVWPLLLIAMGALFVYRAFDARRSRAALEMTPDRLAKPDLLAKPGPAARQPKGEAGSDDIVDVTAILGGFERNVNSQAFRGGDVSAILGGCALDMRGASIQGEAVLNVFSLMGGITIKCPPDWTVVLHGTPIVGGFEERTVKPQDSSKRLVITGYAILGGVEVRN